MFAVPCLQSGGGGDYKTYGMLHNFSIVTCLLLEKQVRKSNYGDRLHYHQNSRSSTVPNCWHWPSSTTAPRVASNFCLPASRDFVFQHTPYILHPSIGSTDPQLIELSLINIKAMLDNVYLLSVLVSVVATIGLTWLFYPAILAAFSDSIEWESERLSSKLEDNTYVILSLVIPAYNEEARIPVMIEEAHRYLTSRDGRQLIERMVACAKLSGHDMANKTATIEWLIVNDGSTDDTCRVVKQKQKSKADNHHFWKLLTLKTNSGKGAAVKTGMLNAIGLFRLMVDADGATDFGTGLEDLVTRLELVLNGPSPSKNLIIFGSRAHLQKTTRRSFVRTILMLGFHFFVSILVSSKIKDTQCGFKLFSKESARACFSRLHLRRWAFDTELLILCKYLNVQVYEVAVPWHEIDGSKLATSKLALAIVSLSMLRDMICVRACYSLGIWGTRS